MNRIQLATVNLNHVREQFAAGREGVTQEDVHRAEAIQLMMNAAGPKDQN